MKWSEVPQSCPTLCDPMDWCSPPGSSIHGILQARILEWVAISLSRGSSQPRDRTQVSCIVGRRFTVWATREAVYSIGIYSEYLIITYNGKESEKEYRNICISESFFYIPETNTVNLLYFNLKIESYSIIFYVQRLGNCIYIKLEETSSFTMQG